MSNSPHHYKNLRRKTLRKAQQLTYETPEAQYDVERLKKDIHSSELSPKKRKTEEHLSQELHHLERQMQVRKARGTSSRSKRTTAGLEVDYQTTRKSMLPDTKNYRDIAVKKGKESTRRLNHKLEHQKKSR